MEPEVYFLKYAFPCSQVLRDIRKTITDEDYQKLEKAAFNNQVLPRSYLEHIFYKAFEKIRRISDDVWDTKTIRRYFQEEHNDTIPYDLPPTIRRLCEIKKGKVLDIKENVLIVDLGDEKRNLLPLYENPQKNDKVFIHYGYAVEKIDNR